MSNLRVLIISFTDTTAEPRVLRQLLTLRRQKIPFFVASFAARGSHPEASGFIPLRDFTKKTSKDPASERSAPRLGSLKSTLWRFFGHWARLARRLAWFVVGGAYGALPIARRILGAKPAGVTISRLWFRLSWREIRGYSQKAAEQLDQFDFKPNLVIFHDYFTSNLAFELSEKYAARTLFDVHEHAISQYSNQPGWLKFISPMIRDIEEEAVKKSDSVVTVGEEIKNLLGDQYGQPNKVQVVRSVAESSDEVFRASSYPLKLLYSGGIAPERGLGELVRSLVQLQDRFRLTIKGPAVDSKYETWLRQLITELKLENVVKIEKPCEYHQIVQDANNHDIGVFVQPNSSQHKRYALPNKVFSYIAAGLALCVSDYPELSRISRKWGFAILVDDCRPKSIVSALEGLSIEKVNVLKRRALIAARELNWEKEELGLINILEQLELSNR